MWGVSDDRTDTRDWLAMDDKAILADCDVHTYKSSGPGGQHRNKVSSAVRLRHRPTGISAHGDDSRSQHENKRLALKRLRMQIALQVRRPVGGQGGTAGLPAVVAECLCRPRGEGRSTCPAARLDVGRKDGRFWPVAQFLLDVLQHVDGRLADAAQHLGITTSNLVAQIKKDRHLFGTAQDVRKRHGQAPLK